MKKIALCIALTTLLFACKKTEQPVQSENEIATATQKKGGSTNPTVTTNTASTITSATATTGGSVSSGGGGNNVIERGVCYNTSPNPTIGNNKVISGSGSGDFTSVILDLAGSTTYYARAYATKSTGTTYGNQIVFTTLPSYGTVTDIDGNVYHTITIGSQVWTVENLKTTRYRDGTPIAHVTDDNAWYAINSGAYCSYNNDDANVATYGRLYNWFAVNDAHNIAPAGWHVPSYTEWYTTLVNALGGCNASGKKLKDNVLWNGDNSSGFKALPGGRRYSGDCPAGPNTHFSALNLFGDWWTSTSLADPAKAWYFEQDANDGSCTISGVGCNCNFNKKTVYSVRIVKD